MKDLTQALTKVQSELKAPKGQFNSFGKYAYRSAEDILEAVKPLLTKHKLIVTITDSIEEMAMGVAYVNAQVTVSDGTDSITVSAQAGLDMNRKGMDVAQCFGASSSYARKYALNGMFLIDDNKDPDATNTHDTKASKAKATPAKSSAKDTFQQAVDYIKGAKTKATKDTAFTQIMSKYGDGFSEKQVEALKKFVK